jgi:hypothetical protein
VIPLSAMSVLGDVDQIDGHVAPRRRLRRPRPASQPALRECRRFVARVGAVSAYARNGVAMTEAGRPIVGGNTAAYGPAGLPLKRR